MMAIPKITLLYALAKAVKEHAPKAMHINNIDLLTQDLGDALVKQRDALEDPDSGTLETLYDMVTVLAEVRVFMFAVSKKLDIETTGKRPATILQEIINATEARDSKAAEKISETMEWTKVFFARPEIQALFSEESIEVELPKSFTDVKGLGSTFQNAGKKIAQEAGRVHRFLKIVKDQKNNKNPKGPKNT